MSDDLTGAELHEAVDRVVEELLARAGVSAPPVDAVALARDHLGMTVSVGERPARRRGHDGNEVVLAPELGEDQRQWAVARAIGKRFRGAVLERLGLAPEPGRAGTGASLDTLFAGRLLVPTCWFAADARSAGWDLAGLKERYRTAGLEALAWRLLDLPEPCVVTLVEDGRVVCRRSNAWRVNKNLSGPERKCQRYVHEHGRPHAVTAGGWAVQGWPVSRAGAAREILRSVVEEEGPGGSG